MRRSRRFTSSASLSRYAAVSPSSHSEAPPSRPLQKHVRGADRTATVADRRHTYGDRTIQSAIGRRPLQVFVVSASLCRRQARRTQLPISAGLTDSNPCFPARRQKKKKKMTGDTVGGAGGLDEGLLYECFRLTATLVYLVIMALIWLVGGTWLRCSLWPLLRSCCRLDDCISAMDATLGLRSRSSLRQRSGKRQKRAEPLQELVAPRRSIAGRAVFFRSPYARRRSAPRTCFSVVRDPKAFTPGPTDASCDPATRPPLPRRDERKGHSERPNFSFLENDPQGFLCYTIFSRCFTVPFR